ncbi:MULTISPECIES: thioredoxin domain-containing protein [unclassified Fibrobacter]|uniref:DsbA family protein n=1 Tax=unclassified Fibrobacter TaxID=2634177 RepID=UPI00090EC65C|nr:MULTISPECIES: thioredoxin domain-containing protein [unclassified Fibrobacter]OWV06116.1 disulfide bond formation protein DsbA [Fibrobacter sp. UWH3]SHK99377.1 Protein-disulfide isomerase [Fibrobacter sp. UWH6]
MKRLSIAAMAICVAGLVACNQASAGGSFNQQARLDQLEKDFNQVKEEFEILKYALDKRGISLEAAKAEMEADNKVWDIPVDESPVFGNTTNPKLTIVEFTEFQCPYCSRIAPTMKELMDKHPGEIKFIYKNFPLSFHANAKPAAAAAIAAQKQGKFWEFRYALAPHSRELTDSTFEAVAKEVGLNIEQFNKDRVLDDAMNARIQKDFDLGVKVGVQGTPNFYINGKRQDRFSPELVEKMLKEAK